METETAEAVKYLQVEISRQGVSKTYGARKEGFIPRAEIRELRLQHGYAGDRRWLQVAFGFVCLGLAAWQIFGLLLWLTRGGTQDVAGIVILFPLVGLGGWLLWDAFHPEWYLEVQTLHTTRKLAFGQRINEPTFRVFLNYVKDLGYAIDTSLFDAQDRGQP